MGLPSHLNGSYVPTPDDLTKKALRDWWFNLIRRYDRFPTYSIFLILPMDKAAIEYLTSSGNELNVISGENCLVLALASNAMKLYGDTKLFFDGLTQEQIDEYKESVWKSSIQYQAQQGISFKIAKLFGIKLKEMPCVVFFKDIREAAYVKITLQGLTVEAITLKLREIFSLIEEAIALREDPLEVLERHKNNEKFIQAGKSIISGVKKISETTLEVALKAALETQLKP